MTQPKREVLRAYLDCASKEGVSSPGIEQIAWMTDYHVRQVQRITHALESDGLLVAAVRAGKTTEYRFDLSKAVPKPALGEGVTNVTPDIQIAPPEMSPLTSDSTPVTPRGDTQVSPVTASHVPTRAGKELLEQKTQEQKQEQVLKNKSDGGVGENADARAKIFDQYSALTKHGIDSKLVADQLKDDAEAYPAEWIDEAVTNAALNGVTNWNYVRKMLQTWQRDGKETSRPAFVKGARVNGSSAHQPRGSPATPLPPSTSEGAPTLKLGRR